MGVVIVVLCNVGHITSCHGNEGTNLIHLFYLKSHFNMLLNFMQIKCLHFFLMDDVSSKGNGAY